MTNSSSFLSVCPDPPEAELSDVALHWYLLCVCVCVCVCWVQLFHWHFECLLGEFAACSHGNMGVYSTGDLSERNV